MMAALRAILWRDLRLLLRGGAGGGGIALPILFFLAVAMIVPFAVGPDGRLLTRIGGGVIWVAALLAAILPLDRLIDPDRDLGLFDQWALRGIAEEWVIAVRIAAHWLSFAPALLLATVPAGGLLGIDGRGFALVELGLLVGTPGLAALGVTVAAITSGLKGGAALSGLLVIPLAVPILIFGAGSLAADGGVSGGAAATGLALTGAASLVLLAIAPFAGAAALRAGR